MGSDPEREELAKRWVVAIVEQTPLAEIPAVPVGWLAREGARLVAAVLAQLGEPAPGVSQETRELMARFTLFLGREAGASRDLGLLHSLLIQAFVKDFPDAGVGDFALFAVRLAEVFADLERAVAEQVAHLRTHAAEPDELTGMLDLAEMRASLDLLLAEYRRYGQPFSTVRIDIEGLNRVNEAYGSDAGDRMIAAVAEVIRSHIREVDRAFRLGEGEFLVLSPHHRAAQVEPMAGRLVEVIEGSQAEDGPKVEIAIGVAACPDNGKAPGHLLAAAEQAIYIAKSSGRRLAVANE